MKSLLTALIVFLLIISCNQTAQKKDTPSESALTKLSKSDSIINQAIIAHGGAKYENAHYSFIFRDKKFSFHNQGNQYTYTKTQTKNDTIIIDSLTNDSFKRTINGEEISLDEKTERRYSNGVNSVIYFATLPYKLKDKSVFKKYVGETKVKEKDYHIISVSFSEEGGGDDHDDNYMYWVNKETNQIDYLAYDYQVNKGGVRFREAFNPRNVEGIIFQNYVNYKAPVGTNLIDLTNMLEKEELEKLSLIETESVEKID